MIVMVIEMKYHNTMQLVSLHTNHANKLMCILIAKFKKPIA